MLSSKQRSILKGKASTEKAIFQIGKEEISDQMIKGLSDALDARELIKITVLKSCEYDIKDIAGLLELRLKAECVCTIGSKIVLYRFSNKKGTEHIKI
ncbi:MAG: YhbY family RNA-binding protein [Clostridia bacterium]|nr:YhbY family RNA-binding protein [Clostridia bacterium]MBP5648831.1 YhbY family RNA-binding protein [Clostridia bacterium]